MYPNIVHRRNMLSNVIPENLLINSALYQQGQAQSSTDVNATLTALQLLNSFTQNKQINLNTTTTTTTTRITPVFQQSAQTSDFLNAANFLNGLLYNGTNMASPNVPVTSSPTSGAFVFNAQQQAQFNPFNNLNLVNNCYYEYLNTIALQQFNATVQAQFCSYKNNSLYAAKSITKGTLLNMTSSNRLSSAKNQNKPLFNVFPVS